MLYLTTLIYLRTILFDYVYDDTTLITLNPWMESWKQVPQLLTHSFWGFLEVPRSVDFYRPLVSLVLATILHLLGPAPGWFHLLAAGLHISATYLVYRLACEILVDKRVSAIAAGLFGLHPTKVETAAWISGISDSLSAVLFLASMIWYFKARNCIERRHKYKMISIAFLLLALFSKEAAILAPILIAVYEFTSTDCRLRDRCLASLRGAWPFVAVSAVAMLARRVLIQNQIEPTLGRIPLKATLLTTPKAILWYLGKQFWPSNLSVQYPEMLVRTFSFAQFVLPLVIMLAVALAVAWAVRGRPAGIFLASWFVAMLAPVIICIALVQEHDRFFYLASVASSIGAACLLQRLRRVNIHTQSAVVFSVLLLLSGLTLNYMSYWDNEAALFTRAVRIAPNNPNALEYFADHYVILGQPEKAEAFARELINTNRTAEGWYVLGDVFMLEGKYQEAHEAMQTAVKLSNGRLLAYLGLATADSKLGRNGEAVQIYRELLQRSPDRAFLHGRLASALKAMGKSEEAARELTIQKSLQ